MSNDIDKRVVQMQFDNQQFDSKVQTSVNSLENLKKGLNLDASAKSLTDLSSAGKSFSLAGIADGVESISNKFSALGIMGVTVLANLTNSAINAGKRIAESLTIDPVKAGLDLYETKINAIQTILTNTASKGTTMDDVTKSLAELNDYANKTIYSFGDMTKNIGTFTAAGVDLKTSVQAIKGIANLAAGSGSSAMQASTAMYQLSQAMASGTVKLMDWNSVVNAGMGGQLFQNALKDTAKQMGVNIDASKSFRDSLESGWLTTEVLTKTLNKFADDPSLVQAATQVKTFTQLFDTMKESVASGWAVSWEDIIGNKNEAAKTLTAINDAFNDITNTSTDARNATLGFWHDNGGRDALIQAITNAFQGLESIIVPVKEAFAEIFPPITGKQLVEFTKGLENLTAKFKMGWSQAYDLKQTFAGLFAVLDIGKQAFEAVAKGLAGLLTYILPAGNGILGFTATIGNSLVEFDQFIKKSDAFNLAVQKIGEFLKPVADGIKTAVGNIIDTFKAFGEADLSGLDSFSDRIQKRFSPIAGMAAIIRTAFNGIAAIVKKIAPIFFALASKVGEAMDQFRQNIANGISVGNFNDVLDLINGGLFAGILLGISKFTNGLAGVVKNAKGTLKGITDILDGVKGCLKAYQSQLKAGILLKIAISIGILAASLFTLSTIDSDKLTASMVAMSAMFVELFGSMGVFEKIMGSEGFKGIGKVTRGMLGVSLAVLILSDAMTKLAKLDWNGIAKGLVGVTGLMGALVGVFKLLATDTDSEKTIKGASTLIVIAVAIDILAEAVKKIGSLDIPSLIKGLAGVGVAMTELSLFMKHTDLSGMDTFKGLGILALSVAISILADAVTKFGKLDIASLAKGLIAVGFVLDQLSIFVNGIGDTKKVISTAIGLTILGGAMLIFAKAIQNMGNMSWEQLVKGLLTMAAALGIVSLAVGSMPPNMLLIGVGLVAVGLALVIMAEALKSMGGMSWGQIAKGLITLAAALTIIAIATNLMIFALPGAAALLVVSAALVILALALKMLGSMSLADVGIALLTLAGVFAVLGISAVVLAPLIPIILALTGAVMLLGLGVVAIGAGLLLFSVGLTALAVAGTAGAAALVLLVSSLLGLIPMAFQMLAEGIVAFADVIAGAGPTLFAAATTLLMSIINAINTVAPAIMACLGNLLVSLLAMLADVVPKMVASGMQMILGILQGIAANIQQVVEAGIDIMLKFMAGIISKIPDIVDTAFKMVIAFINGLADAIRNNHNAIYDAVGNLITSIIDALADLPGHLIDIGGNAIQGLINGMKGMAYAAVKAAVGIGADILDGIKDFLGIHSPSTEFADIGMFSVKGLAGGLEKYSVLAAVAAKNVGETAMDSMSNAMSNISDIVGGDIDSAPTIRPVLDLTDVTNGTKQLNSMLNTNQSIDVTSSGSKAASISQTMQSNGNPDPGISLIKDSLSDLKDSIKTALDSVKDSVPKIEFNGEYSFKDKDDIDYFMNQAALLVDRRKG